MSNQENDGFNPGEGIQNSRFLQVIIYILFFLGPLTGNVVLVLFHVLSGEFGVPPNAILIAVPAFMFPFAIVQLFSGAISDLKGRVPVMILGLCIFMIGMGVALFSGNLSMYLIANILGGIGFGFVNPVLIALMTDITIGPKIPLRMGFLGAVATLGVGVGPLLAGQIVTLGWRYLYLIFILITLFGIIALLFFRKMKNTREQGASFRTFLSHLGQEIKRPVVLVLISSGLLLSLTFLASVIWTSQAFAGVIPESISGIVIGIAGICGAIAGLFSGLIIKKKGVGLSLIIGLLTLFTGILILLVIGNTARIEVLSFVLIGLIFVNIAGGILFPSIMFFSQTLSKERRGALAGLATAAQFIGIGIVPFVYEPFYLSGGISLVYLIILIVAMFLVISFFLLYKLSRKEK